MRPAEIKPATNDLLPDSRLAGPVSDSHCFAIEGQQYVASSVSSLLDAASPPTVLGAIVAIVILAVDAVSFAGALPHIGQEVSKGIPSFADLYPSTAVIGETDTFGVAAPRSHPGPNIVSWRPTLAVRSAAVSGFLVIKTPTTFNSSLAKVCACSANDRSAIALERPENLHPVGIEDTLVRYGDQPMKAMSGNVDEFAHVDIVTPVLCVDKSINSTGTNHTYLYAPISVS